MKTKNFGLVNIRKFIEEWNSYMLYQNVYYYMLIHEHTYQH